MSRARAGTKEVDNIIAQVADALFGRTQRWNSHRDIKPETSCSGRTAT